MWSVESVVVARGGRRLVDAVTHTFVPGRVTGLLGPNGAGKTTLLNVLSGSTPVDTGAVAAAGRPIAAWSPAALARHRAVVPQSTSLGFDFSVAEVVALGVTVPGFATGAMASDVATCLQSVGLASFAERRYLQLSGGERQRVHLARALAQLAGGKSRPDTTALLLDEPTASLDPAHQALVLDLARREAGLGRTVVVVLHDLNLAAAWCDDLVMMDTGRIIAAGSPRQVLTDVTLQTAFGATFRIDTPPTGDAPYSLPHHLRQA